MDVEGYGFLGLVVDVDVLKDFDFREFFIIVVRLIGIVIDRCIVDECICYLAEYDMLMG
ncbi:diguanylate cyclase, partial [Enterococcus hirae]